MFSLSVQKGGYLLVVVSGPGTLAMYCAVTCFVAELLKREPEQGVLVDLLASEPELSLDEHRQLGEHVARLWTAGQVAIVVPGAHRVLVGEQAAVAGGANIRAFTDLLEAGNWLLSGTSRKT